jgi:hypothetical protein
MKTRIIFFASLKSLNKGVGSGSVGQRYGSTDPDSASGKKFHGSPTPEKGRLHSTDLQLVSEVELAELEEVPQILQRYQLGQLVLTHLLNIKGNLDQQID